MTLLEMRDIHAGYGGVDILNGVSLAVAPGEIVVMVGPNGAGKSTALKTVCGLITPRRGTIRFDGQDITGLPTEQAARCGICYVPQTENVFPSLTVHENLEMGAFIRADDISGALERVYALFPPLLDRRRQPVRTLSGGQRQMVAMGRALMLEPRLLLLDEPTAGLSPLFTEQIFATVRDINRQGVAILMVEQNARRSLALADRGYVLALGANRFEDTGAALLANREVAEMFLGG
ncbi:MAG TPA: ABC transporter ATP-binding protein [Geminicoccaceae bacterium]